MSIAEDDFTKWFMNTGLRSPESLPFNDARDLDIVPMADGRSVWARFYGEAPVKSVYKGAEDLFLIGDIHIESSISYESYLFVFNGPVMRLVTDSNSGEVTEGPSEASPEQQLAIIELLDPYLFP